MTAFIIFFCIITPTNIYNSILKSTKMKKIQESYICLFFTFKNKKAINSK